MAIQFSGAPFKLTPQDMGVPDYGKSLAQGLTNYINANKAQYAPQNEKSFSMINQAKAKYADQREQADLNSILSGTESTNINNTELGQRLHEQLIKEQTLNKYLDASEKARIARENAMENYYRTGGPGGSTGSKDYSAYVNGISQDNPGLTQEQLREASDVLAKGGNQLSDGTVLNPMSFGTKSAFDRAVKATTTANQINTLNSANQADAELDVFTNMANKMRAPYGTTYFGKSPAQLVDSFKNDDASQTRLGKLIAANALEFDIAQARNRIGMGSPGITSTNQMMDEAQQHIALYGPRLSAKARSVANEELNKALKAGLSARNKGGYGAGNLYQRQFGNTQENSGAAGGSSNHNPSDYNVPEGWIGLFKNGEAYYFPPELVNKKLSEGYTYE